MLTGYVAQGVGFLCLVVVMLEGATRAAVWAWRRVGR